MTFRDFILDWLSKTTLFELAYERQHGKLQISGRSMQLVKHLIKYFYFEQNKDSAHWLNEIDNWIGEIDDVVFKPDNKKLPFDGYVKLLIEQPLEHGVKDIDRITSSANWVRSYSELPRSHYSKYQILEMLKKILEDVCFDLSRSDPKPIIDYINLHRL